MSCGVCRQQGSDLRCCGWQCRLAAAAPIQPLAWELPYAAGAALKKKNKKIKKIEGKKEKKKRKPRDKQLGLPLHSTCLNFSICTNLLISKQQSSTLTFFCLFLFFRLFRAAPEAYGGSQARGLSRAVAASLCQSHINAGSKPRL